ncbi:MaoC/PaaZ C-terminal domain-containing protein [Croceicoccus marinus]|uniref:MaoC family dehydratase N-terminal domain-containing protein n=1 Tax=Croceicoccus marinus TaxID=450378 RepID=A0A7G6W099_9SPHN|nr:MaoC/PaaZ C-terminal domain-containing protein [Croceicoccus marinus]QNE07414.1 MaoC family dehydratase N-terminal domain-containing protein [Croceicoccus marinus]
MSGTDPNRPTICFEDLEVGDFRKSRSRSVTRDEIVEFARQYDPQWFHSDPEAAKDSVFGEVVASGIHVLAMWRQLDHEINSDIDYVCGIGWDEMRLHRAIRSGDVIHVTSRIVKLIPSKSRDDRGTALTRYAVVLEDGTEAVTFTSINLVYTREGRRRD